MKPLTQDIIALLTRTYRASEEEVLDWLERVLNERRRK
jgi:hypothetical protein